MEVALAEALLRTCGYFTAALVGRLGGVAAGIGVALPLDALLGHIFSTAEASERERARQFCQCLADELAVIGPKDEGTRSAVCSTIEAALQRTRLTHRRLVELNLDPDAAMRQVAAKLDFATPSERTELEDWCKRLIRAFYDKLPRHAHILAEMLPDLWAVLLQRQAEQDRKLDKIIEQNKRQLELLEQEKGIPHAALLGHLVKLGADERIEQVQVPAFLERFATEFVTLREQWTRASNADPGIAAAREEALALLDTGDLDGARQLFRTTRARIRELRQEKAREEATLLADEASVDRIDLRYRDAAALLAEAADLTAFDPEASWRHRFAQADVLYDLGNEFGDNPALTEAVATYAIALGLAPRDTRPVDWAQTQNNLGNALQTLGERQSRSATLERAVEAYEAALLELTRERVPLGWAQIQNNLGAALQTLGERESDTATLERAVLASEAALLERTRERVPLDWAATQNNLGTALGTLGGRESGTDALDRAVQAFEATLLEWTRERVPLNWAMTQNNLGAALAARGERESGTASLERAVRAFEAALEERSRERVPLNWATTQNNLGAALRTLGERESGTDTLERAVEAYEAALLELTRERVPLDWAMTQNNLGEAFVAMAKKGAGANWRERAEVAFEAALEVFGSGAAEYYRNYVQRNLDRAQKSHCF